MAETMSHVERVLWRIAELGARCSQQTASGARGPLWAELEQTIAGLEADFEAAGQAVDTAPTQVRTLEGRLKVARQERDRERARAQDCFADAEAARRERDRAIQKAKKAMAITVEAKNAAAEAKAAAAECIARATAAEAAADEALAARDEAVNALSEALASRNEAVNALEEAIATGERAADARDEAVGDLEEARRALDDAKVRIAELEVAVQAARAGQDHAVDTLAARAEGAVVVLPGVALPEAPAGPVAPSRVSWQPTWSEWAKPDADEVEAVPAVPAARADEQLVEIDGTGDILLDDSLDMDHGGVRRYLNVAATIAQLLPEDLGPLLLSGATVVRREGRLCATVAVTTNRWAAPGSEAEQAQRFADAGFRVEWTANAPLGV